jgi:hypothetical protein
MTISMTLRRMGVAALIAITLLLAQSLLVTSHKEAASASWATGSHQSQSVHELANPPLAWPGTRAAHTVTRFTGTNVQTFYTKTSTLDFTWDFYKRVTYLNS